MSITTPTVLRVLRLVSVVVVFAAITSTAAAAQSFDVVEATTINFSAADKGLVPSARNATSANAFGARFKTMSLFSCSGGAIARIDVCKPIPSGHNRRAFRREYMQRSTERILTTHVGSLPRPDDLIEMLGREDRGESVDDTALWARTTEAVAASIQASWPITSTPSTG